MVCHLDGTGVLEQRVQVALLGLQIRVSTNVLLRNEDVGHGSLARHLAECALDRGTVICTRKELARVLSKLVFRSRILHHASTSTSTTACAGSLVTSASTLRTNLIQLDSIELCAALAQQLLCLAAVRAVAL
jgi:hypothetical protein